MTTPLNEGRPHHAWGRALSETLTAQWREAFDAVPREWFIPDVVWAYEMDTHRSVRLERDSDPEGWLAQVYADVPLVTQWEEGQLTDAKPGAAATSSASMPSVVANMLRWADVQPGQDVWEVGTGTGWNAALLAHHTGRTVLSTEIDPAVASEAQARLEAVGADVHVEVGDALSSPSPADVGCFDRIIVTCGVRDMAPLLPYLRTGGMVVAPWGTSFGHREALVRLTKTREGHGIGKMLAPVEFMRTRTPGHESGFEGHGAYVSGSVREAGVESTTRLPASAFPPNSWGALPFVLGLRVPHCRHVVAEERDGMRPVWLYGLTDRSWAVLCFRRDEPTTTVFSHGRALVEEVEAAYEWWHSHERPSWGRLGLTVEADGTHRAWVDDPTQAWLISS